MENSLEAGLAAQAPDTGQEQLDMLGLPPQALVPGEPPESGEKVLPDAKTVAEATHARKHGPSPEEREEVAPATARAMVASLPPTHPARQEMERALAKQEEAGTAPAPRRDPEPSTKTQLLAGKYESVEDLEKAHLSLNSLADQHFNDLKKLRPLAELGEKARPLMELLADDPEARQVLEAHIHGKNAPPDVELRMEKDAEGNLTRIVLPSEEAAKLTAPQARQAPPAPPAGEPPADLVANEEVQRFRLAHPEVPEEEIMKFYQELHGSQPEDVMERLWETRGVNRSPEEIAADTRMSHATQMERAAGRVPSVASAAAVRPQKRTMTQEEMEVAEIVADDKPKELRELERDLGFGM